ncbi:serine carboxypeptidase S28-domain-containing protein [Schizophyllum amplum]|uniref:Serine carboxypeptidase S28-domain-containing protein n=1 Tax=Schizophyllum amplum TaxID=97359 RepID=A0A550CHA3_9AGAR|nr:serine carboxypeptidase S28-domain-containing protein [Auriculariopsis ampla]
MVVPLSLLFLTVFCGVSAAHNAGLISALGPQGVNLIKLDAQAARWKSAQDASLYGQQQPLTQKYEEFPAQWFEQPLDHFNNETGDTFGQRYWVNKRHYLPGTNAPVIVLDGGETSGEGRIPFLDTGIVEILTRATGGVGVVLEHRYYGETQPVQNLTTDSLRFLTNEQSAADSARFMANVKFEGIDEDLTAPGTPWIYYGGSYAGARAAHMRVLYPDLVFGAIASSAVTHADITNWQYMEVIRRAAPEDCSRHLESSIQTVDAILAHGGLPARALKALFGLAGLEHDDDFASVLSSPLGYWQAKCWDPKFGSNAFDNFCDALSKPPIGALSALEYGDERRMFDVGDGLTLDFSLLNYAKYIRENVVSRCTDPMTVDECFGTYDDSQYIATDLDQDWRLWLFQVCTQWGYFTTAPPDPAHPRILSKLITLEHEAKICAQAFPPGKHFTVPSMPNVTAVNVLGDFDIAMDRLAIIDGEVDPWRPDTPHSEDANDREDTISQPFKLIPNAVHHYDEYGYLNIWEEPVEIQQIHGEMVIFVTEWLKEWNTTRESR